MLSQRSLPRGALQTIATAGRKPDGMAIWRAECRRHLHRIRKLESVVRLQRDLQLFDRGHFLRHATRTVN
jgi:hypothetical protein